MGRYGWHIVVLVIVVLLLFGARKLPDIARSIGQSLKVFKKEVRELQEDKPAAAPPAAPSGGSAPETGANGPAAAPEDPPGA
ncbi:MAG: Sec-independent protein translocase subunit TatA [Bifidobacteriaceae bacterium]|jgi:sec-independent protein translocase protein TatA|nr:Sec-independent protein translocase subunit TatA [Bifidobacteriaceae bacterium]